MRSEFCFLGTVYEFSCLRPEVWWGPSKFMMMMIMMMMMMMWGLINVGNQTSRRQCMNAYTLGVRRPRWNVIQTNGD